MRFAIGEIPVSVIVDDDDFPLPLRTFLPDVDPAMLAPHRDLLEPDFVGSGGETIRCAIQSFVLQLDGRTILIDACIGEHKDRPEIPAWHRRSGTGWLDRLRAAGVAPEAVDLVFCTHLHIDHVGWNTVRADGGWAPTFPNARYLVGRRELADWQARLAAGTAEPLHRRALQDSVVPLLDAGLVEPVDDDRELATGLVLAGLPGHTVGQMGLRLDRPGARALFCGDAMHSPIQILQPGASTASCHDAAQAARTRHAFLQEAAASGRVLVPAHFRGARRATVTARGAGFVPAFPT